MFQVSYVFEAAEFREKKPCPTVQPLQPGFDDHHLQKLGPGLP